MVLVEKICQLSFENDAQTTTTTPMSGVETATQRPLGSNDATCKASTVASDDGPNETGGSVTPSDVVGAPPVVSSAVTVCVTSAVDASVTPTVATHPTHTPAVAQFYPPALIPAPRDPPSDSHADDDSVRAADAGIDASADTDAENTWTLAAETADGSGATTMSTDATTEPPASWNFATSSRNRKRGSRRTHMKPARGGGCRGRGAGKTEDAGVVERTEDKMRGIKTRPLRQRNCDRTVQPWVACNKSLVYSMIDSALGATEPAAPAVTRQVVVTSPVALETVACSGVKCRAAAGAKDVDAPGSGADNPRDHAELPKRPTGSPGATCEAPLLGALLSYDDAGVTNNAHDIPILPTPPPLRRQHHLPRGSSPVKAIRRIGSNWHRTLSEELRVPSPFCRNLAYSCSAQMIGHPFLASPIFSAQVRNAEILASGRPANRNILRSIAGFSGQRSRFAHQTGSGSNSLRHSERLPSDLDPLLTESRRIETSAKTTVGPDVERPRWIALDKDEVHSLVDSLVSTMMTSDDDITRVSAARCRRVASPSNAICNNDNYRSLSDNDVSHHDNDETGCQRLILAGNDSGRHDNDEDNRRLVATDSVCYDDDEATIEYGRFVGVDLVRHDDGKRGGGWRSRALQCLSTDGSGDYPVEPGCVARDNRGECSVARGVSEGLARSMLKWKSSMLMRLHSQSQDEEK